MTGPIQCSTDLNRAVEELLPGLYNTACYLAGDPHRAEDLVQETIVMFLESSRKGRSRIRNPRAWCSRVLARVWWKKRIPAESTIPDDLVCSSAGPEATVADDEQRRLVRDSLQTLPPAQRQAIVLHVFGGLTVREVAKAMELPRSTAHERLHSGLAKLRGKLSAVSAIAPLPIGAAGSGDLIAWLQALPQAPVPSSLLGWSASAAAAASSTGASLLTQASGGILVSALSAKPAVIGVGAVMLIGLVGLGVQLQELREQNRDLEQRVAAAGLDAAGRNEIVALRESNRDLRRRLAALERERSDPEATPPPESANAAARMLSPADVEQLLQEANSALHAHDRQRFATAFLALIDAGPAAYAAIIELVAATGGSYNHIYQVLEGDDADYPFRHDLSRRITERRALLAGLLDAILSRAGELDGATLFAFDLMTYNLVLSGLPRDEHVPAVFDILSTAIRTEEEGVKWNSYAVQAARALGRIGATETVPELERMLMDPDVSDRNKAALAQAIAAIGSDEGVAALRRIRDAANVSVRGHVFSNLMEQGGAEIDEFLQESLAMEQDSSVRQSLVRAMSKRSSYRDDMVGKLERGELGERERLTVLESLFESEDSAQRDKAWEYYQQLDRNTQDEVVGALAGKDARATEIWFDRLGEESFSDELARGFQRLDSRTVHRRAELLREVAGDVDASLIARGAAAGALARVDAGAAVDALLDGFDELPERERRDVIGYLADYVRGAEARAALERIATTDSAPKVRAAAERATNR